MEEFVGWREKRERGWGNKNDSYSGLSSVSHITMFFIYSCVLIFVLFGGTGVSNSGPYTC
jgi:hypothetical protein